MNVRSIEQIDETVTQSGEPRRELAAVLEKYLADLENGVPADREALLSAHPDMAAELRPYLDSLHTLHAATAEFRTLRGEKGRESADRKDPARKVGDYRIVREIGRGGMGVVYEAHQESLNRPVALKILPFAAVLDQRQIARFRNEAQAAAQLHHPHIVPVFAVGQEHGVYYYAMQLIEGQSLHEAIDQLQLTVHPRSDRTTVAHGAPEGSTTTMIGPGFVSASGPVAGVLSTKNSIRTNEFFRSVARLGKEAAEALHHAHEFGIVHRDVKPSNLLLDRQAKLWVTDFGLARMQNDSGVTLTGDVVGTLRYMSPEQATGRAELVDHRTDVYSLGVTLYELLTLEQAFAGNDRHVVLRKIELEEPLPPRRMNPAVPIDLETIVLQAMAKSREDRYPSAAALADDLGRFLTGQPALARRPSPLDRAAKWARRHRAVVGVAAAAVVVLSIVSSIAAVMLLREQSRTSQALALAETNELAARRSFERAEENYHRARDVVDQFGVGLADRLVETPGAESIRRDLLAETLRYYGEFIKQAGDDPRLRHEAALAHFKSGVIAAKLGEVGQAVAQYEKAEAILAALHVAEPGNSQVESQLALVHNNLAILAAARGDVAESRRRYERAIAIGERLVAEDGDDASYLGQLAESQSNLAMLCDKQGDAAVAEELLRNAVASLRQLAGAEGDEPRYARNLSIASNNLSYVLSKRDATAAEAASREAVETLERLAASHPERMQYQDDLALCYNNLAALYSRGGRTDEAIAWHERAVKLQEQLIRKAPAVVRYRSDLAVSLNNLGVAFCRAGQVDRAEEPFTRARELFATLADDYPEQLEYRSSLASLLNNQALAWARAGRHERAVEIYPDAVAAQRRVWEASPGSKLMQELLSKMVYNQGRSLAALERWDEALDAARSRREIWRGDGERLFSVAVELAELAEEVRGLDDAAHAAEMLNRIDHSTVAMLREAIRSGCPAAQVLADDPRFAHLRGKRAFRELLAESAPSSDAS